MPRFGVSASSVASNARFGAGHADGERRRRQHEGVDVALPGRPRRLERAGDETRDDQAAEAVAEQDQRAARLGAHGVDDRRQVGEQIVAGGDPAALARARAVAALVVADDAPAVRVQARRDVRVATDVLAEAVDDDNRPPGVGGWPVAAHQRHAVTGSNRPSHRSPSTTMTDTHRILRTLARQRRRPPAAEPPRAPEHDDAGVLPGRARRGARARRRGRDAGDGDLVDRQALLGRHVARRLRRRLRGAGGDDGARAARLPGIAAASSSTASALSTRRAFRSSARSRAAASAARSTSRPRATSASAAPTRSSRCRRSRSAWPPTSASCSACRRSCRKASRARWRTPASASAPSARSRSGSSTPSSPTPPRRSIARSRWRGRSPSKSPLAIAGTKLALNHARDHSTASALQQMTLLQSAIFDTGEMATAIAAWKAKGSAEFARARAGAAI